MIGSWFGSRKADIKNNIRWCQWHGIPNIILTLSSTTTIESVVESTRLYLLSQVYAASHSVSIHLWVTLEPMTQPSQWSMWPNANWVRDSSYLCLLFWSSLHAILIQILSRSATTLNSLLLHWMSGVTLTYLGARPPNRVLAMSWGYST